MSPVYLSCGQDLVRFDDVHMNASTAKQTTYSDRTIFKHYVIQISIQFMTRLFNMDCMRYTQFNTSIIRKEFGYLVSN